MTLATKLFLSRNDTGGHFANKWERKLIFRSIKLKTIKEELAFRMILCAERIVKHLSAVNEQR